MYIKDPVHLSFTTTKSTYEGVRNKTVTREIVGSFLADKWELDPKTMDMSSMLVICLIFK